MATLTVQQIKHAGLEATYAAAAGGGDVAPNDGRTFLHVKNGGGSPINVTVAMQPPAKCSHGVAHDVVVAVTNAEERFIGPFPKADFDNASGQIVITYSGVTSVTIAAFSLHETGRA